MFKSISHAIGILSLLAASLASAETVTVRSGNGTTGGTDSSVHFLLGPPTGGFGHTFTSTDFVDVQIGAAAYILVPNGNWISGLSADPAAKWIGSNANAACASCQGNTALYAVSFTITKSLVGGVMTLYYAVDDAIGESDNPGVYINGTPVCANSIVNSTTDFTQQHTVTCNSAGSSLHVGTNWLYIEALNSAGPDGLNPAGLIFSATITTTEGAVLPDVVAGGVWTTGFFVTNPTPTPAQFSIQFFDDNGNALPVPFGGGSFNLDALVDTVPALGMNYYEASAPSASTLEGWGLISGNSSLVVQALFREQSTDGHFYEAAVPSSGVSSEFVIPFDASTVTSTSVPVYVAFAIANLDPTTIANVTCVARDQVGNMIPNAVSVPPLNPLGHWAAFSFPLLTGHRGSIDCSSNTAISAIALHAIGGGSISSLPVITQ